MVMKQIYLAPLCVCLYALHSSVRYLFIIIVWLWVLIAGVLLGIWRMGGWEQTNVNYIVQLRNLRDYRADAIGGSAGMPPGCTIAEPGPNKT